MKTIYFLLLSMLHASSFGRAQTHSCEVLTETSGEISEMLMKRYSYEPYQRCWKIKVPEGSYVRLDFKELDLCGMACSNSSVNISVVGTNEEYGFCSGDKNWKPVIALGDIIVKYMHKTEFGKYYSYFKLQYNTESIMCAREDHFRCSNYSCIHKNQLCDGAIDCENGEDEAECGISEEENKLRTMKHVPYSLYIGDHKYATCTVSVKVPENSSAYDIMTAAQNIHPKYRFLYHNVYGHPYVYEIARVKSDPMAGKFWYLYTFDSAANGLVRHEDKSLDEFIVSDGQHLIMWYRSSHP